MCSPRCILDYSIVAFTVELISQDSDVAISKVEKFERQRLSFLQYKKIEDTSVRGREVFSIRVLDVC